MHVLIALIGHISNVPNCEAPDSSWLSTLSIFGIFWTLHITIITVTTLLTRKHSCTLIYWWCNTRSELGSSISYKDTSTHELQGHRIKLPTFQSVANCCCYWATAIPNKAAIWSGLQNKPVSGPWVENALSTTVSMDELTLSYNWAIQTGTWASCTSNFS